MENDDKLTLESSIFPTEMTPDGGRQLTLYALAWSLVMLIAVPFGCIYSGEGLDVFYDYWLILVSPSKLVTDYFDVGGLGAALLNAAVCGLVCNLAILLFKPKPSATLLAGYFLVIAHCFYGLNLINMLPPFFGVLLFCALRREKIGNQLHVAFFATSLAPFISDFLFRYTLPEGEFTFGQPRVTAPGVILALIFGLLSGFIVPALIPGTSKMHRGYNLFKAGLAIGIFGMFAYALFYRMFNVSTPDAVVRDNALYLVNGKSYLPFMDVFFGAIFLGTLLLGYIRNGCSFKGYKRIWKCDGWQDDFAIKFGMPLTWINIGLYGLCVLAYLNLAILCTDGVGYTGATAGVTIAAITFSASGQTPRNVWPIAFGYLLLYGACAGAGRLAGLPIVWSISSQPQINGLAFATGLCPIAGRYGRRVGVIAGMLNAILCTSTAAMHGGFVLYNGGLTAGLTALILIPILDYYKIKPRENSDGL